MTEINVTQADKEEFIWLVVNEVEALPENFNKDEITDVITELTIKYSFSSSFNAALYVLTKALNDMQKKFDAANRA